MRFPRYVPAILTGLLLLVGSCQQLEEEGPTESGKINTSIRGLVVRSDDSSPVPLAIVQDANDATKRDTTDANGAFQIVYALDPGENYRTSIFARRELFGNDTSAITLRAGSDTSLTLTLIADSSSPVTSVTSGSPASIVLIGTDVSSISIRGSGVNESALLTFEVRDSLGNAITGDGTPDTVRFNIIGGPGGDEYVFPKASRINSVTGRVTTRLNSGTRPGVIQVEASTRNDSVISAPARITIASGPPDSANVSISRDRKNIPGLLFDNERVNITIILGDRWNNPVPEGTAVYFSTNGGLIQATGKTDADGIATVALISANPRPPGGLATVWARTIGDSRYRLADTLIQRSTTVTFSGAADIVLGTTGSITLPDSGRFTLNYSVHDQNGNPLVAGTQITVSVEGPASGELVLTGDSEVTLEDTDNPAATSYSVTIADNTRGGLEGLFTVRVSVKGPNGDVSRTLAGYLSSSGSTGTSGPTFPKAIALSSISSRTLSVKGTGGNQTSSLSFTVRDSLGNPFGNPLDPTQKAYVMFTLNPSSSVMGGASLSTVGDSTNDRGIVNVTFTSGSKAGVVQVIASTPGQNGIPITASPVQLTVQGGLPDQSRFLATISKQNLPGLIKTGPIAQVNVQAADEFGNPAQSGTAVYFSTTLGLITASSQIGEEGTATVNLSGGVPGASSGVGQIVAQTFGKQGEIVSDSIDFLFTGSTQISIAQSDGFFISDSGSYSFSYTVSDQNANPLSEGTAITVSAEGPGSADLELSGDVAVTLPDTRTGYTNFNVRVFDKVKAGVSGPVTFRIAVSSENGAATATHSGTLLGKGQSSATGGGTTFASSIELASISPSDPVVLSVAGTGVNENAILQFIVKDSLGSPVDEAHAASVNFSIHGGPGGDEFVFPASATTDASGIVTTTFNAGKKAGVLQIRAQTVVGSRTISSAPVAITIVGGLPDSAHMTVWSSASNYPGWITRGEALGQVFVQLGDEYGNPVQPNTSVYFTSNGGQITGTGFTDDLGHTQATIFGGEPFPPGGVDSITISTVDKNNVKQSRIITVTFSGAPVVTPVSTPNDSITIFDGGFFDLDYIVADVNGNPLAAGNSISMSLSGTAGSGIALSGDNGVATIDTRDPAFTKFRVRISDNSPNGGVSGAFTLRITVSGPNGSTTKLIYGTLGAPQAITPPSPTVKAPAQVAFIGISASDIFVSGVGALENTVITYEVRDSLGSPIEANPRAYGLFSLVFLPNTWAPQGTPPRLIPNADSTDNAGRLRVSISSGTTAGIIQVVAKVGVGVNDTIISRPVKVTIHAGFPDQRHFTIAAARYNFPGLGSKAFVENGITVQIADKYSNPVEAGTAVYFYSQHGTMQTGEGQGLTDSRGFVSRTLNSANPFPRGADSISLGQGWSYVYAQTVGDNGNAVIDSVLLLWTGNPIVRMLTANADTFTVLNGGTVGPFTFEVVDFLGHPMSAGTSISVTASGGGKIDGDADIVMKDTQVGGQGVTRFTITVSDSDDQDTDPPTPSLLTVLVNHPEFGSYKQVISTGTID